MPIYGIPSINRSDSHDFHAVLRTSSVSPKTGSRPPWEQVWVDPVPGLPRPWRGRVLGDYAREFWAQVGFCLKRTGKIIIAGCFAGLDHYGQEVANVSQRTTYASADSFAAGNVEVAPQAVAQIERTGVPPHPMMKFVPGG